MFLVGCCWRCGLLVLVAVCNVLLLLLFEFVGDCGLLLVVVVRCLRLFAAVCYCSFAVCW